MNTSTDAGIKLLHEIDIQGDVPTGFVAADDLHSWTGFCLGDEATEVCLRLVSEAEMAALNGRYRNNNKSTNVLSFPGAGAVEAGPFLLGDVVICPEVVMREALEQKKTLRAHVAHMVVHGILHLKGFDHIDDDEADEMESKEIALLGALGFPNPYVTGEVAR